VLFLHNRQNLNCHERGNIVSSTTGKDIHHDKRET
jgi:hypothetical protein